MLTRNRRIAMAAVLAAALLGGSHPARGQEPKLRLLANLRDTTITESSGLAVSRRHPGIIWTHNDSGGLPALYATDRTGASIACVTILGAKNVDWEDIAVGPDEMIYIGDFGDNGRSRSDTAIYGLLEPPLNTALRDQQLAGGPAARYPFEYPDGHHDCETLLVHPVSGAIYLVTKEPSGESGVYRYPMPLQRERKVTLERIAAVRFSLPLSFRGQPVGRLATGGAFSPDGSRVAIRSYAECFEWTIGKGQTLEQALAGRPRRIPVPLLGQFESLCYTADGRALLTTSEGSPCQLWEAPIPLAGSSAPVRQ